MNKMEKIKKIWVIVNKKKIKKTTSKEEIISLLLGNRGISSGEKKGFLNPPSPFELTARSVGLSEKELKKSVRIINEIGRKGEKMIIFGDYDCDGICATAILWEVLWRQNFNVFPFIPDRVNDGYGISIKTIDKILKIHPETKLIITVDNGIVADKAIKYALKRGLKIIITDHHLLSLRLPPATAILHTTQLSGSGLSWFLAKEFGQPSLELAALGTIADIMPLLGGNRSVVKFGLLELSSTKRVGLKKLIEKSGLKKRKIGIYEASFVLAPRVNASGRMADSYDSLRLLCTTSSSKAERLATHLNWVNKKRQEVMLDNFEKAKKKFQNNLKKIVCVAGESYHQGTIGLVAGKLVEEFSKPAVVVWKGKKISKGSARSLGNCNIIELIRKGKNFLIDVGGHPLAAGFTLKTENITKFFKFLESTAEVDFKEENFIPELKIDAEIEMNAATKEFYYLISSLSPFGFGNPEPTFLLKGVRVLKTRRLGENGNHLKLWLDDPKTSFKENIVAESIGFGLGFWQEKISSGDLIDLVFNIDLNVWNGGETLQFKIKDIRKSEGV